MDEVILIGNGPLASSEITPSPRQGVYLSCPPSCTRQGGRTSQVIGLLVGEGGPGLLRLLLSKWKALRNEGVGYRIALQMARDKSSKGTIQRRVLSNAGLRKATKWGHIPSPTSCRDNSCLELWCGLPISQLRWETLSTKLTGVFMCPLPSLECGVRPKLAATSCSTLLGYLWFNKLLYSKYVAYWGYTGNK